MSKKNHPRFYSAQEAAELLGISRATLYAYVSRGLVRSEPDDSRRRTRRYNGHDVRRLQTRQEQRRDPAAVAEKALNWGTPLLESAVSLISGNNLYYRGYDARFLAENRTLEEVAALIWLDDLDASLPAPAAPAVPIPDLPPGSTAVDRFQAALPLAAAADYSAYDLRPAAVIECARRIMALQASCISGEFSAGRPLAKVLQQAWAPDIPQAVPLLNQALILCADHELNASAFTARVVASTEATPYQVVMAGLAALRGRRHGAHTERVAAMLREVGRPQDATAVLAARLRRGEPLPGFGHPLYPEGDPRGAALLEKTAETLPYDQTVALAQAVTGSAWELYGKRPNVDFGLVTLAGALQLPPGAALTLFALGRTVGWIGQALEQYAAGSLIRPRARYIGRPPENQG